MRNFFLVIIAVLLLGPTAALAHDVLVIQGLRVKPYDEAFRGFRNTCSTDARRVYLADIDTADLSRLVREERPRLIVAIGADALNRAQKVKNVPILYLMVLDPRPALRNNGNVTGVAMNVPPERYFQLLARVSPAPKRIGLFCDPAKTGALARRARQAAETQGMQLEIREVSRPNDVPAALAAMAGTVDALLMLPDTTVITPETVEAFLLFSQNNKIPVIAFAGKYVEMGALFALDIDGFDQGRQAGEMARRILDGTPVAGLPAAEARKAHLKTNRSVAKKLGVSLDAIER